MKKILLILIIFVSTSLTALAQNGKIEYKMTSYDTAGNQGSAQTPLINVDIFNNGKFTIDPASDEGLKNIFQAAFNLAIGITIALSVIMFMIGAFEEVISKDVSTRTKLHGKEQMKNSIYSLVFVLSAWLIINTINPDLLNLPLFSLFNNAVVSARQTGGSNVQATPVGP